MTLVTHPSSVNLKKKKVAPGYLMSYCRKKCHIEGRGKLMASCHPYGTFFSTDRDFIVLTTCLATVQVTLDPRQMTGG